MARMPELPEVETVRRRLGPVLEGATIERAEISDPRLTRPVEPELVRWKRPQLTQRAWASCCLRQARPIICCHPPHHSSPIAWG